MKNLNFLFCCLLSLFSTALCSQAIITPLNEYAVKNSTERIYVHYDKNAYSPGDTIWFKVYLFEAFLPALGSKTLYINWADDNGNILNRSICPVVDGISYGQITVPENLKSQSLIVYANTRWMLNFDSSFLYRKNIKLISNAAITPTEIIITQQTDFLPEGGNMVVGLKSKIAFKSTNQYGEPIKISGEIVDQNQKLVTTFSSTHNGMGFFYLLPEAGKKYMANWKDAAQRNITQPLPQAINEGVTIEVTTQVDRKKFKLDFSPTFLANNDSFLIIGTIFQKPVFSLQKENKSNSFSGTLPTADLPTGILTITVFDNKNKPVAERITYIKNNDAVFTPTLDVNHWGLNKKALNELKLTIPDNIAGNFSISITDGAIYKDTAENIFSQLLLAGELNGKIHAPAYYFNNPVDSLLLQNIDLVMLTNGWRKIRWNEVMENKIKTPSYPKDTTYIALSGRITGVRASQIAPNTTAIFLIEDYKKEKKFALVPIEKEGNFSDPSVMIFDTTKIYYQFPKSSNLHNASIEFLTNKLGVPKSVRPYFTQHDTTNQYYQLQLRNEYLKNAAFNASKMLEEIVLKSHTKSKVDQMEENYASAMFASSDGYKFDLLNDPFAQSAMNIFSFLQGRVAGLNISQGGSNPTISWRGGTPAIYLNEVEQDVNTISTINVSEVAFIKVIRPPFYGGFNGANGAIAIYTKKGNDNVSANSSDGMANSKVVGYSIIRDFYSPKYSEFAPPNTQKDIRTTLYWNPMLIADNTQKEVVVKFYNNEISNSFRVVLEGVSTDGKLAHIEMMME